MKFIADNWQLVFGDAGTGHQPLFRLLELFGALGDGLRCAPSRGTPAVRRREKRGTK